MSFTFLQNSLYNKIKLRDFRATCVSLIIIPFTDLAFINGMKSLRKIIKKQSGSVPGKKVKTVGNI